MRNVYTRFLVFSLFLFASGYSNAQTVRNYAFAPSASVFTPLLSPNAIVLTGSLDEGYANNIPIGFNFVYNSVSYSSVAVSTNGYVSLGNPIGSVNSYVNNLSTGTATLSPRPILAPLWDDLNFNSAASISYQTTGTAPYRIFTVQWLNARWAYNATNPGISFQLRLKEYDSKVEFIYRPEAGALLAPSASIGISNIATGSGNFLCLASTGNNPYDTNTVTEVNTLNAKPASGQLYTFAPQYILPNQPDSLSFTGVSATSLNVGWTDNTLSETYYQVYVSADNINFAMVANLASGSTSGTGTAYQYSLSNLLPGNIYYFRVFACNEGSVPTLFTADSQATDAGLLSGIKTICPLGCDYTSIGNACADIRLKGVSGSLILELDATYSPAVESYPLNFGNLYTSAVNTVTLRPRANVVNPIRFVSVASPTFDLNTTDYLTIDGKPYGGTEGLLHISNLSSSGTAIRFINDATHNTLTDCRISGASSSLTSGVLTFAGTTGTEGNSNNFIMSCNIKDTLGNPMFGVYSAGNASYPNVYNTLYGNNIYDYYNGSNTSYGILLGAGNSSWFIGGNSFYQTGTRSLSFNAVGAISASSGSGYTLFGNYMGGSAPMCGGTPMVYNGSGTLSMVNMNLPQNNTCLIQGNTIQNLNLDLSGATHALLALINGDFMVDGNTLGSSLVNDNIVFNSSGSNIAFSPIMVAGGSSYGNVTISSNSIGGIRIGGTGTVYFRGINIGVTLPSLSITGNTLGSSDVVNSIVDSTNLSLFGIYVAPGSANNMITDNVIANLNSPSAFAANRVAGIYVAAAGTCTVQNNSVFNLRCGASSTGTLTAAINLGIMVSASGPDQLCNDNLVYALVNTHPSSAGSILGIYVGGSSSGNNVLNKNFVHSLFSSSTASSVLYGIYCANSSVSAANNRVRLGMDTAGIAINLNHIMAGMVDAGNANSFYHNSVYMGGNAVASGPNNSYAFYNISASTGIRNIKNNIFYNARSNALGTGKHYALYLTTGSLTQLDINYNLYYAPGTGGFISRFGATDYSTLSLWRSNTFLDYNSGYGNPNFVNPGGNKSNLSLSVQSQSPAEAAGTAITEVTDDYEGQNRSALSPTDIGADAGNYTGLDIFMPTITVTPLTNTSSTFNRTVMADIKDVGTGVRRLVGLSPKIWYRRVLPTLSPWVSNSGNLVSGTVNNGSWTFLIDYNPLGPAAMGQQYQYYIVVQDSASPANISYNPYAGASHTDVNTQITSPTTPLSYRVVGNLPTSITVGTAQAYTTLTGAGGLFNAINNGALAGNTTVTIVSDIIEPGSVTLSNAGLAGYNLLIKPDNSSRILLGTMTANGNGLITLNGANNVTIDGGPNRNLTIRNSIGSIPSTSTAPAIHFLNGRNDTLRNCIVESNEGSGSYATVYVTTNTISSPMSGLMIHNNIIRPVLNDSTNGPSTGILLNAVAGNINQVRISANTISNFTNYGIYVANAGSNIKIGDLADSSLGNKLYQSLARGTHYHLLIASGSNYEIGYNSMYSTAAASHTGNVYGLYAYNNINNVQVAHNSFGGASYNRAGAAYLTSGAMVPFTMAVGSLAPSSLLANRIGNVKLSGTSNAFIGIQISSGAVQVSGNTVGGASQGGLPHDSISLAYAFYGIRNNSAGEINISDNKVSDIYNYGTGYAVGMSIESGVVTLSGNTISNLYTYSTNYTNVDYSCVGIRLSNTGSGNLIETNQIYNLFNHSSSSAIAITGIAIMSSLSSTQVQGNRIYNLVSANNNTGGNSASIRGIYISGSGSNVYANNQITLLHVLAGTQPRMRGIELATTGGTNTFYFNSVYIGGVSAGANTSSCFLRNTSSSAAGLILKNNILYNERSGSGNHYALSSNVAANFNHDYNLFVAPLSTATIEYAIGTNRTLASWNSFTGNPVNNLQNTPAQVASTLFFPNLLNGDLYTNACRVSDAGVYVSVNKDINNASRSLNPDIGSVEFTLASGTASVLTHPVSVSISCGPSDTTFSVICGGLGSGYQWQENRGAGWLNLSNTGVYSGVSTPNLKISGANAKMNGYQYRCKFTGACLPEVYSNAATLSVSNTSSWTGAASTNWANAANWSCGTLPSATTDVLINNVLNLPIISDTGRYCQNLTISPLASLTLNNPLSTLSINGNVSLSGSLVNTDGTIRFTGDSVQNIPGITYKNIALNNSNGANLSGNINVLGTLTFMKGILSMGAYSITLNGSSSSTAGANMFRYAATTGTGTFNIQNIGNGARTGSVLFPVGSSSNSYNPITLANTGTADEFRVKVLNDVYNTYTAANVPNGPLVPINVVNRSWIVTELLAGGSNVTVGLQWNLADELPGFTRNTCYVSRFVGSAWSAGSTQTATGANPFSASTTSLSSFGVFGVGSGGLLPVELIRFEAMAAQSDVLLNWQSAMELNLASYVLERSLNGYDFEEIARIKAYGNSSNVRNYVYTDRRVWDQSGAHAAYYRLKMLDLDGSFNYSNIRLIKKDEGMVYAEPILFPNPGNDALSIMFWVENEGKVLVEISDANGKVLSSETLGMPAGEQLLEWRNGQHMQQGVVIQNQMPDLSNLTPQIYFVRITPEGQNTQVLKWVKR